MHGKYATACFFAPSVPLAATIRGEARLLMPNTLEKSRYHVSLSSWPRSDKEDLLIVMGSSIAQADWKAAQVNSHPYTYYKK